LYNANPITGFYHIPQVSYQEKKLWQIQKYKASLSNCYWLKIAPYVPPGQTSFCVDKGYVIDFVDQNMHTKFGIARLGANTQLNLQPKDAFLKSTEVYCGTQLSGGIRVA
jgi:hypothetical protein